MAWDHQATSHYLKQCWLRFIIPYGVSRGQWIQHIYYDMMSIVNSLRPSDAYMRQQCRLSLFQILACRLIDAKPLSEPTLVYCQINFSEISMEIQTFSFKKMRLKSSSAEWQPSCLGLNVFKRVKLLVHTYHTLLMDRYNIKEWVILVAIGTFPNP